MGCSGRTSPSGPAASPRSPHRFYLATDIGTWQTTVRSAATGKAVAVVPVPSLEGQWERVAGAGHPRGMGRSTSPRSSAVSPGEQIYRFRLTPTGHVTEFARIPGGSLRPGWAADALAASPNGSLVAVGAYDQRDHRYRGRLYGPERSDQLIVIHTATGAQSIWRGGSPTAATSSSGWAACRGRATAVSWPCSASGATTGNAGGEFVPSRQRQAQLRAIEPAGHRRRQHAGWGRLLLPQSPRIPFLAQALISPDGSTITAMVLHGRAIGNPQISGIFPAGLSVEQISVTTGRQLTVLYRRHLGDTSESERPDGRPAGDERRRHRAQPDPQRRHLQP